MTKVLRRLLVLMLLISSAAFAQTFTGKVVGIQDGDTITIMNGKRAERIRLANIDAPEKAQPFGQKSKQSMSDLAFGKIARVEGVTRDKYGRLVARVEVGGKDLSREQVRLGMASVYAKYNQDAQLPEIERAAKAERRGLWTQAKPQAPADYRAARKAHKPRCRDADGRYQHC